MSRKIINYKYPIIVLIFTIIGFLLRVLAARKIGSFWFDEYFTVYFSNFSLKEMFGYLAYENNPPLHFLLTHYWVKLVGESEFWVRFLSIIFGTVSIPTAYFLGKKLFSQSAGLISSLLIAFTSFNIYYSVEARMYGLLLWLGLFSLLFFYQSLHNGRWYWWLGLFITNTLLYYTHLTSILLIFGQAAYFAYFYFSTKKKLLVFLLVQTLSFLCFLPWLINFFQHSVLEGNLNQSWYFNTPYLKYFFAHFFGDLFAYQLGIRSLGAVFGLFGLILFLSIFKISLRNGEFALKFNLTKEIIFLWLILLPGLIIAFLLNYGVTKYLIVLTPAIYLLSANFISAHLVKFRHLLVVITVLILLFSCTYANLFIGLYDWDKMARYIELAETNNDIIITHSYFQSLLLSHYYHGRTAIKGFYPLNDDESDNLRLVKNNWEKVVNEKNVNKINDYIKNYQGVFLVYRVSGALNDNNIIFAWFISHGWQLDFNKSRSFEDANVFYFKKNNGNL